MSSLSISYIITKGEDVVAGIRTLQPIEPLSETLLVFSLCVL